MNRLFAISILCFLWAGYAGASSYSECKIMGVVEDIYYGKIHFRTLKVNDVQNNNFDINYNSCSEMKERIIALYDKSEDAANEPCEMKVTAEFKAKKYANRWKDNVKKGDMLEFDYEFYQGMSPSGGYCVKSWNLTGHTPLN